MSSRGLHETSAHVALLQYTLLGAFVFGMRHSEEAKCFAYLSLLLCRYTILFRELRRAFGRRRLRGRPTTFRRLSLVSSFPRVYWSRRTDHIAYLVRLKRSLVLARAVSFVTLLASMTRMHGPMPSETQTHFRTVQFFTFSQLSSPAWSYKATATTPLCLFLCTSPVQLLCSCRGFLDLPIS